MNRQTSRYRVADINLIMTTECERTEKRAEKYLVKSPGIDFDKTAEVIELPAGMAEEESSKYVGVQPDDVEYMLTGRAFYTILLKYYGLMLHSSAVVVDGYAYLFSADSGTGKSTHTELWLKYFKDRAFIINDDKPALRKTDGKWYVYGTPWSGKNNINVNTRAELGAIVFLERSENNWIEKMTPQEAIPKFMAQTVRKLQRKEDISAMLSILSAVLEENPIYRLGCDISEEAVITSYEAIRKV